MQCADWNGATATTCSPSCFYPATVPRSICASTRSQVVSQSLHAHFPTIPISSLYQSCSHISSLYPFPRYTNPAPTFPHYTHFPVIPILLLHFPTIPISPLYQSCSHISPQYLNISFPSSSTSHMTTGVKVASSCHKIQGEVSIISIQLLQTYFMHTYMVFQLM